MVYTNTKKIYLVKSKRIGIFVERRVGCPLVLEGVASTTANQH